MTLPSTGSSSQGPPADRIASVPLPIPAATATADMAASGLFADDGSLQSQLSGSLDESPSLVASGLTELQTEDLA